MAKRTIITTIIFASIFLLPRIIHAQNLSFGVNVGTSNPSSIYWKSGFAVGGNVFYSFSPLISVGAHIAYNRYAPDVEERMSGTWVPGTVTNWSNFASSGGMTIIEIVSSFRITAPLTPKKSVNFFGQLGAGLFLISAKGWVKADYTSTTGYGWVKTTIDDDSINNLGLNLGGGLAIKITKSIHFEILPLYHIMFRENKPKNYFSVSVCTVINLPTGHS